MLLSIGLALGCVRHHAWRQQLAPSLPMPSYDVIMEGTVIDGPTLRALQVAADDFFPASSTPQACIDTPEAHRYYAVRHGEVIYVAILQEPSHCGRAHPSLDAGARYAIGVDGRILRRLLDGEPDFGVPEENGPEPVVLDGGAADIDVTVSPDAGSGFPGLAEDAGTH
ncbi:hypothetical protein ACLESO_32445 [Pyxidicoccus sp. 3LG]